MSSWSREVTFLVYNLPSTELESATLAKVRSVISKTAEYALRAVIALAAADRPPLISADELAKKTQVPRRYLTRVLQDLAGAGLVASRSGPGGGYEFRRNPSETTILDVINAVSPLERLRRCPLNLESHTSLCPLHAELDRAYEATEKAFAAVTLSQLLNSTSPINPLCNHKKDDTKLRN